MQDYNMMFETKFKFKILQMRKKLKKNSFIFIY
jgi:hypothetical protein